MNFDVLGFPRHVGYMNVWLISLCVVVDLLFFRG